MRTIVLIVLALVILVAGYFSWSRTPASQEESIWHFSGVVSGVNLDAIALDGPAFVTVATGQGERTIAVPSMGIMLCAAYENIADVYTLAAGDRVEVLGAVNEEGQVVPCEDPEHYLRATSTMTDATYGYAFDYRKGPDGYVSVESPRSEHPDFVTGLMLFNKRAYDEAQQATEPREGPPGIGLQIYENPERLSAFVWPTRHPRESNIELAFGEPEEAVVGGANAARYIADGLYPTETYVIASGQHIYVLTGSYNSQEDQIYQDFRALVESFRFVPAPGQE